MTVLKDYMDHLKDCAEGGAGTCRNADIVQELQDKVERLTRYISELCRPIEDSAGNGYMPIADCIQHVQKMAAELEQARARIAQLEPKECAAPTVPGWYWAKWGDNWDVR